MSLSPEQQQAEFDRRHKQFQDYLGSTEYQEKLIERLKLNDAGERRADARSYIWHLCARPDNPVEGAKFFLNNFGWTFDPRPEHAPNHLPFITFEYQDQAIQWFIDHVDNGRDGLLEKSRDMGASWLLFVWLPIWYWLFRDGISILVGSYKEDLVDDRTIQSLFGKIDYALESLPKWMMPKGFKSNKHRVFKRITNPANGNLIIGDSMNPRFGRGSRQTVVLFDELGFWDYAKDAWESCGDTASCRIANSTPQGYNYFASLKESGIDVLTLIWKLHPLKDDLWYAAEQNRRSEEEMAQEIDLSYSKSREGRVYPEWNDQYVIRGLFPYEDNAPLYVGWDFGKTDDTGIIWAQPDQRGRLRIVDVYRNTGKNIDFYVPLITGIIPSEGYTYTPAELDLIEEHKEWRRGTHFGDPAGRFRNQISDETVFSVLRTHGIIVNFKENWKGFETRRRATKTMIMNGINMNENQRTLYFNICMINAAYPKVRNEGVQTVKSEKPKHDWTSHYRSALEYLALGMEDHRIRKITPKDHFPVKPAQIRRRATTY